MRQTGGEAKQPDRQQLYICFSTYLITFGFWQVDRRGEEKVELVKIVQMKQLGIEKYTKFQKVSDSYTLLRLRRTSHIWFSLKRKKLSSEIRLNLIVFYTQEYNLVYVNFFNNNNKNNNN